MAERTDERVALVTGGGSGIGRAVAVALAQAGFAVAVAGRRVEPLQETVAAITSARPDARSAAVSMDVTDEAQVEAAVTEVEERLGAPMVLVNDAGFASSAPFAAIPREDWDRALAVNVTGAWLVTRRCLPAMVAAGWGRVVNVGSTAALRGYAYTAHYTASKHALLGLTRALADEVGRKGVTANCVCPGFVDTEMTARSVAQIVATTDRTAEQAREALARQNRSRRLITPDEVAAAVTYLVSDAARSVNGDALRIE